MYMFICVCSVGWGSRRQTNSVMQPTVEGGGGGGIMQLSDLMTAFKINPWLKHKYATQILRFLYMCVCIIFNITYLLINIYYINVR